MAVYDGLQLEQKRADQYAKMLRRHDELVDEVEQAQVRYRREHEGEQ